MIAKYHSAALVLNVTHIALLLTGAFDNGGAFVDVFVNYLLSGYRQ